MTSLNASRGFTLIEVLVAITLMAILSLIGWKALDAVERTSDRLFGHADETLMLIGVVGQLERDIRQHAGIDLLPLRTVDAPPGAAQAQLMTAALPPGIFAQERELLLVRSAGQGLWQQVHWRLENGALHRAVGPASSKMPLPEPTQDDVVLDGIEAFDVRAWLPGRGWTAPPLPAATRASGLEIVVIRNSGDTVEPYRKVVLLQ